MASQIGIVTGIAGRYALALFDLAKEAKALDATAKDLDALAAMQAESAEFSLFIASPRLSRDEQVRGVGALAEKAGFGELTRKFLGVLATNRRLSHLGSVIGAYRRLLAHHNGEVTADVTSARALDDGQMESLKKTLKSAVGRDVAVAPHVDESLLGGLVVKIGSRMVDSSLKTKLDNLKVAMKGVQ
ncbi:F0F1 ATP synthase subunit delta [Yunchengibacter salinarum]|uniref:F0F1 ATP synthase subunit delta n=1 Tax=Yunchengibacter salinarum TaxID=3133399 RepID=UPI0035B674E2